MVYFMFQLWIIIFQLSIMLVFGGSASKALCYKAHMQGKTLL